MKFGDLKLGDIYYNSRGLQYAYAFKKTPTHIYVLAVSSVHESGAIKMKNEKERDRNWKKSTDNTGKRLLIEKLFSTDSENFCELFI
jgi:hypothetical protein